MTYNSEIHHRRSIRLKDYDYSQSGAYFVTVCAWKKECLFGEIQNGEMLLNDAGIMVHKLWNGLSVKYPDIETDEFVVMPNHIHGMVVIVGAQFIAPFDCDAINQNRKQGAINHAPTIGEIVRAFKARCTCAINATRNAPGVPLWQRNYYEHIIRDERELHAIRKYIRYNPLKWEEDTEYPNMKRAVQADPL